MSESGSGIRAICPKARDTRLFGIILKMNRVRLLPMLMAVPLRIRISAVLTCGYPDHDLMSSIKICRPTAGVHGEVIYILTFMELFEKI